MNHFLNLVPVRAKLAPKPKLCAMSQWKQIDRDLERIKWLVRVVVGCLVVAAGLLLLALWKMKG